MLTSFKKTITLEELAKERLTHTELSKKLKLLDPKYKIKFLSEIPKPALNYDFMCHTYSASYVLQWYYANNLISAKPFPVRNRETQEKINTKIPKAKGDKKDSFISMRFIGKSLGLSTVGELMNGDELCALVNHCKVIDPNQNYTAENLQIDNKKDYINTLINAINCNTPPIVIFDSLHPIGFRKGEQEHATVITGYVQSEDKTYFIALGGTGYWLTSADILFSSAAQLEPRYYNKEIFQYEDMGQKTFEEDKKKHTEIVEKYKNSDTVKVTTTGMNVWCPVTKLFSHLPSLDNQKEVMNGLPAKQQKNVIVRQNKKGWKNTIVIIRPDNKKEVSHSFLKGQTTKALL